MELVAAGEKVAAETGGVINHRSMAKPSEDFAIDL